MVHPYLDTNIHLVQHVVTRNCDEIVQNLRPIRISAALRPDMAGFGVVRYLNYKELKITLTVSSFETGSVRPISRFLRIHPSPLPNTWDSRRSLILIECGYTDK
ncbi:hypothetical protein ACTXT7_008666, partial [Hymenolepis weldensis]